VSNRAELFLGIIAAATLASAIVQIGVLVVVGLLVRRIQRLVEQIEQEMKPIVGHLNAIGRDASRAAALATAQVERVDRLMADVARRLEQTLAAFQGFVTRPLKDGVMLFHGIRTLLEFVRDLRVGRRRAHAEDEDALFI
jgi:predicted PurR-regulated permease PerM